MAKKIFPGNWVAQLSSYQGQGVVSEPGRVYYQKTGYAKVDSTGGTSFDVVIPSPDLRGDDKARADITGLTLPAGANVYSVGIRVPDVRKDKGVGTATSGLVGTNTNRLKVADAIGNEIIFSRDDESMEATIIQLCRSQELSLGLAESMTGGLIASRITSQPGSSDVFKGGIIPYSTDIKQSILKVSEGPVISKALSLIHI